VANWSELKLALENEAKSVSGGTGELIRVESDPKSESALVISSKSKRMTLTYVSERNAVRWETAAEHGFERLEEPIDALAKVLLRWLVRR
jgi:hypothetical protein